MKTYKAKFQDEAGFYFCTWYCKNHYDFWARVAKEEREYKSNFKQLILD
jgi:hypothetical protein